MARLSGKFDNYVAGEEEIKIKRKSSRKGPRWGRKSQGDDDSAPNISAPQGEGLLRRMSRGLSRASEALLTGVGITTAVSEEEKWIKHLRELVEYYARKKNNRSVFDPPYEIFPHLYIGTCGQAEDKRKLKETGITHIVNCQPSHNKVKVSAKSHGKEFDYQEIGAVDEGDYDLAQHHDTAYRIIEEAREAGGKAFLFDLKGVNICGFLAVTYTMAHKQWNMITAFKHCIERRGLLLMNTGFQQQLVDYARDNELLEPFFEKKVPKS